MFLPRQLAGKSFHRPRSGVGFLFALLYLERAAVHSWCAGIKPIPQARRELLAERLGILI